MPKVSSKKHSKSKLKPNSKRKSTQIYKSPFKKQSKSSFNVKKTPTIQDRLLGAKFRFLNQQMYAQNGLKSFNMYKNDPEAYKDYHKGYEYQTQNWPVNPLDIFIKECKKLSKSLKITDLGCGKGRLGKSVPQSVISVDLVALDDHITVGNMTNVDFIPNSSQDRVIFCLSLVGTDWQLAIREASRIIKTGGILRIAEVTSRLDSMKSFVQFIQLFGFDHQSTDDSNSHFVLFSFVKVAGDLISRNLALSRNPLSPCVYKIR